METLNQYLIEALIKKASKIDTTTITVKLDKSKLNNKKFGDKEIDLISRFAESLDIKPYLITNKFKLLNGKISTIDDEILLFFSNTKTVDDYFNTDIKFSQSDYRYIEIIGRIGGNYIFYLSANSDYDKKDRSYSSLEEGLKKIKNDVNIFFSNL